MLTFFFGLDKMKINPYPCPCTYHNLYLWPTDPDQFLKSNGVVPAPPLSTHLKWYDFCLYFVIKISPFGIVTEVHNEENILRFVNSMDLYIQLTGTYIQFTYFFNPIIKSTIIFQVKKETTKQRKVFKHNLCIHII